MSSASLADLRRIAEALRSLRGRGVDEASLRGDARQLKMTLDDGSMVLIGAVTDEHGRPRLEVDVVHAINNLPQHQLEVHFD